MPRLKRAQFWGRNIDDDSLVRQIMVGAKAASADLACNWHQPGSEYDEGGYLPGDLVEVYDLHNRLRCHIRILEVYQTTFACIPEKLWRGEGCASAEDFRIEHRKSWADETLADDTRIVAYHFELVSRSIEPSK
jgi:uncharacterized protein YhfF